MGWKNEKETAAGDAVSSLLLQVFIQLHDVVFPPLYAAYYICTKTIRG